ncbi:DinI-like family protein [Escherichia coli]|uniref:DinI-like family protein n=1 Tax=Escherichia coli TaxID=562 RepID=UPI0008722B76|nr:DinI-like family protein [Escherichia coli]
MRVEICIAKEKITKMPNGAVDALKEELTRRISKRYDDVEVIVKTFVQETLKDTWESADEWFVR